MNEYLKKYFTSEEIDATVKATVKCSITIGPYDWCGLSRAAFLLTMNEDRDLCAEKGNCQLVTVDILLSPELLQDMDRIFIYDETGFLAHYSLDRNPIIYNHYRTSFSLKYVSILENSTDLKVDIIKTLPPSGASMFRPPPRKILYSTTVTLPKLDNLVKSNTCPICLESVEIDKMFLTECGHSFHNECIFDYINANKLTEEKTIWCNKYCKHSDYIKPFKCPTCRRKLNTIREN